MQCQYSNGDCYSEISHHSSIISNHIFYVFKQIQILCESDEYFIVEEGNDFGLSIIFPFITVPLSSISLMLIKLQLKIG